MKQKVLKLVLEGGGDWQGFHKSQSQRIQKMRDNTY